MSRHSRQTFRSQYDGECARSQATFTEDELKDYYIVYENKAVKHIGQ
jgi:hypothetical protein